ncbi:MAG: tetratricopeptide repeat protein [Phycisphaerales bacterium]
MAAKVNTTFVVILSVVLLGAVGGVAFTASKLMQNSAGDLIQAGDAKVSEGNIKDAVKLYSKAVNKEKTNVGYLRKWIDAIEKYTPEGQLQYEQQFAEYQSALRQLMKLEPENPENLKKFIALQYSLLRSGPYREAEWSAVANEVDSSLKTFEGKSTNETERLRRYRGLLNIRRVVESAAPDEKMRVAAKEDLNAALKADPTDAESMLILCDVDARDADKVRRSKPDEAKAIMQQVSNRLEEFLAKNPNDPQALCALVQFDLSRVRADMPPNAPEEIVVDVTQKFFERSNPRLDKALESAKAMPQPVPEGVLLQLIGVEALADPASRNARAESLVREGLKARPDHAALLLTLADIAKQRNDYNTAVEQLDKVTKLPDRPISLEGISLFGQRKSALLRQALWAVRQWQLMPAGAEKDAAFKKCQELRDRASSVAADDARLLFVDAQIAFVKNTPEDTQVAARLLDEYNRKTSNSDIESQLLTAQVAIQRNQPGLARDALNRILRLQPNSIVALQALGDLERVFQNFDAAKAAYRQLLRLQPNNEPVQKILTALEAMQDPSKATDPVVAELAKLNKFQEEARDQTGTNERLLEMLKPLPEKYGQDPRLALPLAQAYMMVQDMDNAIKVVDASLAKFPENAALLSFKRFATIKDPTERAIAIINAGPQPEVEKLLAKQLIYRQAGMLEKSQEMLATAVKSAPDDKRVLEAQFVEMLERDDHNGAKTLVDRAVRENLDGFNGDSYRARLVADEGRPADAVTLLRGVVARGGAQPEVYRLLGRMLAMDNRVAESIDVYKEGQKLRPNDIEIALDVMRSLAAIGRSQEALEYAREFRKFGENNLQFLRVWLALEAQVGDRERAIVQREAILRSLPGDRDNAIALIELYINTNKPAKALELISIMRQRADGLDLASLDATMLWAQGKQAEAKKAFEDAIAKFQNKDKPTSEPELLYAQFLGARGDVQSAVEAMNRARAVQDDKLREVDRAVSDFGVAIGSTSLAINGAKNVVSANADTKEHLYQKRVVEMLLAEGKANDAATEHAKLPQGAQADAQTLLIGAAVAEAQNDIKKAKDLLNEAVTRFPTNMQVFQRRGQMLMKDKTTVRDAIEDFTRMTEIQPQNPLGLRLRAQAYDLMDEKRKMDADLRAAIKLTPTDDTLVFGYMSDLVAAAKEEDADLLARDVLKARPKDVGFMMRNAAFFKNAQRSDIAQRWCKEAFAIDPSDSIALAYLSALLDVARPDVNEGERVLNVVGDRAKNNPMYMMATAKIRFAQNKNAEAVKLASDAAKLFDVRDEQAFMGWNGALQGIVKDPGQYRQVLANFASQGVAPDWMGYFRGASLLSDPAKKAEGLQVLDQLNKAASTAPVRRVCYNRRGEVAYAANDFEKAASIWREGVKEFPSDVGMVNNLAYVLSKHLNKHEEALPLAEQAAQALPNESDVLDTLGYVYLKLNRAEDAGKTLERAGAIAKSPTSAVTVGVHYIEALKKLNRIEDAKAFVARIAPLFDKSIDQFDAELRSQWQAAVDSVK